MWFDQQQQLVRNEVLFTKRCVASQRGPEALLAQDREDLPPVESGRTLQWQGEKPPTPLEKKRDFRRQSHLAESSLSLNHTTTYHEPSGVKRPSKCFVFCSLLDKNEIELSVKSKHFINCLSNTPDQWASWSKSSYWTIQTSLTQTNLIDMLTRQNSDSWRWYKGFVSGEGS